MSWARAARIALGRLNSVPGDQRALALACAALLPCMALALRLLGFARLWRWLRDRPPNLRRIPPQEAQALAAIVKKVAERHPVHSSCLVRSLVLYGLLARRCAGVELRVGSTREGDRLLAHAWVEHEGVPLNDAPDVAERYPPFPGFPQAGRPREP